MLFEVFLISHFCNDDFIYKCICVLVILLLVLKLVSIIVSGFNYRV